MGKSNSKPQEQISMVIKIALVGTYAVGKTSIASRFIDNEFNSNYMWTRGKSFHVLYH